MIFAVLNPSTGNPWLDFFLILSPAMSISIGIFCYWFFVIRNLSEEQKLARRMIAAAEHHWLCLRLQGDSNTAITANLEMMKHLLNNGICLDHYYEWQRKGVLIPTPPPLGDGGSGPDQPLPNPPPPDVPCIPLAPKPTNGAKNPCRRFSLADPLERN